MSGRDLHWRVWGNDRTAFDEVKYLSVSRREKETHISCWDGNKLVGDIEIENAPYESDTVWMKHVTVRPQYQNMGIAKQLLDRAFQHINAGSRDIVVISSFSDQGKQYIKSYIQSLETNYPNLEFQYNSD